MRYAEVYNRIFSQLTIRKRCRKDKRKHARAAESIVRRMVTSAKCLSTRLTVTRHLNTLVETQTLGTYIDTKTHQFIHMEHRTAFLGWIIFRLRPLQRKILDFLWKPSGPMYQRTKHACLSAMQSAGIDVVQSLVEPHC